ncbi:MAG: type II/IV secretion system ATPase subunit [Desulfurococcales archaeon]|nr:type II/IV secretion system ATPase subunit [Desulfurococcales archaeon]
MIRMAVVISYTVGTSKVTIVKENGGYRYVAEDRVPDKLLDEVREAAEVAIIGGYGGRSIYRLTKTIYKLIKRESEVGETLVAYTVRGALKYRKLQILIDDPYVEDISSVGPGPVWVRHSLLLRRDPAADFIPTNIVFTSKLEFLQHLMLLAEKAGQPVSKLNPIVDGNLPDEDGGHRVHLVMPEIAGGSGELVVRKKKSFRAVTLKELSKEGMLNDEVVDLIKEVIEKRGSILIVGPPGSGKTTLLRAILYSLIPPSWKVAIIEDTPEIDLLPGSSWVRYVVPPPPLSESINQMILTKAALRSSVSKFIVIGETRGAEAKVLAQAMNMGLGGLTTFHAGSASEAVARLTSHPIGLTPSQITMFDIIAVLSFVESGEGFRREVVEIVKPELMGEVLKLRSLYPRYGIEKTVRIPHAVMGITHR